MTSVAPLDIRPGMLLPGTKYTVVRRMGEGGMGEVFEVEKQPAISGAAKILALEFSRERGFVDRFFNEARILGQIEHPNIVRIFDYDVLPDGRPFFVMELLRGKALDTALREHGTLPPRVAVRVMRQLLSALHCAHTHDTPIVHRDVKPGNIFLHKPTHGESVLKLLDFGISSGLNTKTAMAGTHGYMAPEQLRADALTAQTDLYASALVLFEMLAGHGPFPKHEAMGLHSLQYATLEVPPPRITDFVSWVPAPVADAIASALAKDPTRRPASALVFAQALEPLERVDEASVGRPDAWTPGPSKSASFTAVVQTPSEPRLDPTARAAGRPPPEPGLAERKLDTFASHQSEATRRERARLRWVVAAMLVASACASAAIVVRGGSASKLRQVSGASSMVSSNTSADLSAGPDAPPTSASQPPPQPLAEPVVTTARPPHGPRPPRPDLSAPAAQPSLFAPARPAPFNPPSSAPPSSADAIRSL